LLADAAVPIIRTGASDAGPAKGMMMTGAASAAEMIDDSGL